ncbi:adenylate/guanylate cyclase domain-containing protein [Paroceanicella profunda]|uniref:Adenylate/guanylate cyclase domain-containing protein n=1 Tax=Paroceanicella profunda TaxID=2579971 RepID=A0A5B8FVP6_9RHOB|nr:adenylate/guanylate cyclase domain-containing protein [Paroceanicella profunda]QDL90559.1 adenylate/guanylate cyclase domain-containing protein [Paroceanicella profunda]
MMREDPVLEWLTGAGLAGLGEQALLRGMCEACRASGLPVARALLLADMLDPTLEGRGARWREDTPEGENFEYGRSGEDDEGAVSWARSPLNALARSGQTMLRVRLERGETGEWPLLAELAASGMTDYLCFVHRIAEEDVIGEMDCVYSSIATRAPGGFTEAQVARLLRCTRALALALKSVAQGRVARTLARVYLGHDAAERVLGGGILRGMVERIEAVLWFSDLRGFTTIVEQASPAEIIPFLNDYAEAAITAIHGAGGETLKLIGDGVLAVFRQGSAAERGRQALAAEADFRTRLAALAEARGARGQPVTSAYVGLHVGEVFYGNIGARDRLDFTVVGPAVNEVSRIAAMCRSVDRDLLVSDTLRDLLGEAERTALVSTGRFALRGVGRAQDLYTRDPEA